MATSQTQIFLELQILGKPIPGESTIEDYETLIELDSFKLGMKAKTSPRQEKGKVSTRVTYEDLTLSKVYDRSSPNLSRYAGKQQEFDFAKITVNQHRDNPDARHKMPMLVVTLRRGVIKSVELSVSGGDKTSSLSEDIVLTYKDISVVYYPASVSREQRATAMTFSGTVATAGGQ